MATDRKRVWISPCPTERKLWQDIFIRVCRDSGFSMEATNQGAIHANDTDSRNLNLLAGTGRRSSAQHGERAGDTGLGSASCDPVAVVGDDRDTKRDTDADGLIARRSVAETKEPLK